MTWGSLRFRSLVGWAVFLVITLQVSALGLRLLFERSLIRRTLAELTLDIRLLSEAIRVDDAGAVTLVTAPTDPLFSVAYSGRYWQISKGGKSVLRSPSLWNHQLALEPAFAKTTPPSGSVQLRGPDEQSLFGIVRTVPVDPLREKRGSLELVAAVDFQEIQREIRRFSDDVNLGLTGLAVLFLLGASAHIMIGLQPLSDIQKRLAQVRNGELRRLQGYFPSEVMPLVLETNALLDAQDRTLDRFRTRAADLAHGLKTPLAVLSTHSRTLRKRGETHLADQIDDQIKAMQRHIERETAMARMRGSGRTHHQRIDAANMIGELVEVFKLLPKGHDLTWKLAVAGSTQLAVDGSDFHELMGNLIDNAQKWAKTEVRITSSRTLNATSFAVEDDGVGVDETDACRILERGERADRSVPGTGLGLAIARDIVEAYEGRIEIKRSSLGGLAAIVTFGANHAEPNALRTKSAAVS
jgi:signal transduction histidine kinase